MATGWRAERELKGFTAAQEELNRMYSLIASADPVTDEMRKQLARAKGKAKEAQAALEAAIPVVWPPESNDS